MPTRPSPRSERLGTPNTPAIRFTRGSSFEASLVRVCYGLSGCSPPWTDRTKFPWPTGDFYIQASGGSVALPAAGYDYNSDWTPLLAELSPAGMAARACSTLNLRTGIAFCPSWMRRSYASRRALDETGAADRGVPPQGQDPAPGSAAHDFGHCLATSERGQVARHPG